MREIRPLSAIILGAGLSSRFGGDKLLADLGGRPLVRHVVETVRASLHEAGVSDIRLVVPPHFAVTMPRDVVLVTAADHARGISHSLRAGIASLNDNSQAVFVFLADMPFTPRPGLLDRLLAQLPEVESVRPTWKGRPGHPVLISRGLWPAILCTEGDSGAQAVLSQAKALCIQSIDDTVIFDIDLPADLEEARKRLEMLSRM